MNRLFGRSRKPRPGDIPRQRVERRGDLNEVATHQHRRGHADHLVERPRQVCGIREVRGVCRGRNRALGRDGDHGSRQLAPQHVPAERKTDLILEQVGKTRRRQTGLVRRLIQRHPQVVGCSNRVEHGRHARIQPASWREAGSQALDALANERRDIRGFIGLFCECAKRRHNRIQPGVRDDRDVLPKRRRQPGAFAGLRIHEHHHPEGAVAVKGVLGVWPHDDASRLTPFTVAAADGDASVEGDDDLNRVVCMSGHDALSSGREEEASLPQVPARNAQPAIRRFVVGCVGQAGILPAGAAPSVAGLISNIADTFKNFDLSSAEREDVTRVFVNIGKAIAAYERRIEFGASRFDKYVAALTSGQPQQSILTDEEVAGLRLFIGRANCTQCHNGALLTSNEFHNTGVAPRPELAIRSRSAERRDGGAQRRIQLSEPVE